MRVTVSHFEIPARHPQAAAEFYRRAFDWTVQEVQRPGAPYLKIRTGPSRQPADSDHPGAIQGGIADPDELGSDQPLLVLHLSGVSVEDCLQRIETAGGTVDQPPVPVPGFGHFARFRDPEGNLLGLWAGRQEPA